MGQRDELRATYSTFHKTHSTCWRCLQQNCLSLLLLLFLLSLAGAKYFTRKMIMIIIIILISIIVLRGVNILPESAMSFSTGAGLPKQANVPSSCHEESMLFEKGRKGKKLKGRRAGVLHNSYVIKRKQCSRRRHCCCCH